MELLFQTICSKLLCTNCKHVGLIDVSTKEVTIFEAKKGEASTPSRLPYNAWLEKVDIHLPDCQQQSCLNLHQIITGLKQNNGNLMVMLTGQDEHGIPQYFSFQLVYFDRSTHIVAFSIRNETDKIVSQMKLVGKLQRIQNRFDFLRSHICELFIEVNIQTGACESILSPPLVSKCIYQEQIEWLAHNVVAEEERTAYLRDFELKRLLYNLRNNNRFYSSAYTFVYDNKKRDILVVNALLSSGSLPEEEYIISFVQDITATKQQEEKNKLLEQKAQHDDLTGLYSRSAAEQLIDQYLQNESTCAPGTLAMFDIDYFKQVNDTYGHVVGDFALMQLAKSFREAFRSEDILCRWGGDEFIVFLKNIHDELVIEGRLERLRVRMRNCVYQGQPLPLTLSIGVAVAGRDSNFHSLFRLADGALYKVKQNNRDGFYVVHEDDLK